MNEQSAEVNATMIELAKLAATIQAQQDMIDALKKQVPEPYSFADEERQDHEDYAWRDAQCQK